MESTLVLQAAEREAEGQRRFEKAAGDVAAMRDEVARLRARLSQREAALARQSEVCVQGFDQRSGKAYFF